MATSTKTAVDLTVNAANIKRAQEGALLYRMVSAASDFIVQCTFTYISFLLKDMLSSINVGGGLAAYYVTYY